jgi:hypothetical protein
MSTTKTHSGLGRRRALAIAAGAAAGTALAAPAIAQAGKRPVMIRRTRISR